MPKGFDWKTSFCNRNDCGSKSRIISYKIAGSFVVECGVCHSFIGWLDPEKPLPIDLAREVPCNYGARHYGTKLKEVPLDYIHWLYYHADDMPPLLNFAVMAFCGEGIE